MSYIIGISAYYHDSAAALIKNGKILSAVQEERFTRKKHDSSFPSNSIKFILDNEGINLDDIEYVAFYDKPLLKFDGSKDIASLIISSKTLFWDLVKEKGKLLRILLYKEFSIFILCCLYNFVDFLFSDNFKPRHSSKNS